MRCQPLSFPIWLAATAFMAVGMVGCATWKETPSSDAITKTAVGSVHENSKRVVLEVEFVNIDIDTKDLDESAALWQWIDETAIDSRTRQRLLANGIRVGFVANEDRFRQRLADATTDQDVVDAFLSKASVASDVSHGESRIPMRLGRRYELALKQPIEGSHVALVRLEGETVGRTLNNAQHFFAITATQADSQKQVQLRFRPEIQYGDTRQKWVSSDTAIRIDNRRETWSIAELDLNVTASERDTLVFAAATPVTGLGRTMLSGTGSDQSQQQVVVLVRVAQVPSAIDRL